MNTAKTPRALAGRATPAFTSARSPPAAVRAAALPTHQGTAAPWRLRKALSGLAQRRLAQTSKTACAEPAAGAGADPPPQAIEGAAEAEVQTRPREVSRIPVGARDPALPQVMPA
ncbi:MAG TPA: hypothetical protein VFK82_06015 [Burkholderiaceae bacterium]|nr:hypothetical protein [Burkholderiaceae bacterium]